MGTASQSAVDFSRTRPASTFNSPRVIFRIRFFEFDPLLHVFRRHPDHDALTVPQDNHFMVGRAEDVRAGEREDIRAIRDETANRADAQLVLSVRGDGVAGRCEQVAKLSRGDRPLGGRSRFRLDHTRRDDASIWQMETRWNVLIGLVREVRRVHPLVDEHQHRGPGPGLDAAVAERPFFAGPAFL